MAGVWLFFVLFWICYVYYKNRRLYKAGEEIPGPRAYPILGNSLDFAMSTKGIFVKFIEFSKKYGRFFRVWNKGKLYVICNTYKDAEVLLSSTTELRKTNLYQYFYPWIGEGLISTSAIGSWRKHRKIITPTFHFNILHNFIEVFNKNAQIFCEEMESKVGKGPFNVIYPIKLLALDNICETAMGIHMNAQKNSETEYVKAVKDISSVIALRFFKVWLMIDAIFYLSKYGKIQKNALKVLHGTTNKVIQERRQKLQALKRDEKKSEENLDQKKKLAFLDLLLESEEGSQLSDKELREEVDTFMFAGHDTISSVMSFAFYCLANHPDIQELAYQEQVSIFGDSQHLPTHADLQEMKYLDRVFKEVQRLYTTVPLVGRELSKDLYLPGNVCLPKETQLVINIYALHHDPNVWPEPEKFNPDNFLPEVAQSRNSYAYIPFSAGPRNCLGQKYAMLAMKATFSMILRKYKILSNPYFKEELTLAAEVVLVPLNGIYIQLELRN